MLPRLVRNDLTLLKLNRPDDSPCRRDVSSEMRPETVFSNCEFEVVDSKFLSAFNNCWRILGISFVLPLLKLLSNLLNNADIVGVPLEVDPLGDDPLGDDPLGIDPAGIVPGAISFKVLCIFERRELIALPLTGPDGKF